MTRQAPPVNHCSRGGQPQPQPNRQPLRGDGDDGLSRPHHQSVTSLGRGRGFSSFNALDRPTNRPVNVRPGGGPPTTKASSLSPPGIIGRGAGPPPVASPGGSRYDRGGRFAGRMLPTANGGLHSQESSSVNHSLGNSSASQSSGGRTWAAHQQKACKPGKPPRPPGPPPPHILEEQRKRREMMALQKAQQQSTGGSRGWGGAGRGQGPPINPQRFGSEQRNCERSVSKPLPRSSSSSCASPRNRSAGCTTHLVQAGASILGSSRSSSDANHYSGGGGSPADRRGWSPSEGLTEISPTERCDTETAAGSVCGTRAGVACSIPPASEPSPCSTSSADMSESVVSDDVCAKASSSEWQECWDEEVEASYYYNHVTREALWVRPDGL